MDKVVYNLWVKYGQLNIITYAQNYPQSYPQKTRFYPQAICARLPCYTV